MQNSEAVKFVFDRESKIILYGAATTGAILGERLSAYGFSISGYIDKRAQEIKNFCGKPVYDLSDKLENKEQFVVIVAVKNVFEHSRIAAKLLKNGWENIIYLPYASLNGKGAFEESEINRYYSIITEGDLANVDKLEVPIIKEISCVGNDVSGVREIDYGKLIYVPITMLFTDDKNGAPVFSILTLKPHIDFIKYVLGMQGGNKESYINYCIDAAHKNGNVCITEKWKENVIRNRAEVILNMNHKYQAEPDFFEKNAPKATWDFKKARFTLNSGKHRSAFLAAVGKNYLPIKISNEEYEMYLNYVDIDAKRNEYNGEFDSGFCPITENPYFVSESWATETFWFSVAREVASFIANRFYINSETPFPCDKNVFLSLGKEGAFLKAYLERCGFNVFNSFKKETLFEFAIVDGCGIEQYENLNNMFLISEDETHKGYKSLVNGFSGETQLYCLWRENNDYL